MPRPAAAEERSGAPRAKRWRERPPRATAKRQHLRKEAGLRARPKKPPRLPRRRNSGATISFVVRGLDPRIHQKDESAYTMACRVNPGNDDQRLRQLRFAQARL